MVCRDLVLICRHYIPASAGRQCHKNLRSGTKRQCYWFDANGISRHRIHYHGGELGQVFGNGACWWGDPGMLRMGEAPTEASAEARVREIIDRAFNP